MKGFSFPLIKTKIEGIDEMFILEDPVERRKYFNLKAAPEIEKIKEYLSRGNTFVGFLLGPKNSGKGTYAKFFIEIIGEERVAHISVGDIVRSANEELKTKDGRKILEEYLEKHYRGFISIESAFEVILGRDTKTLLPTEIILALVEREIDRIGKKAVFIDGFPRDIDQISYSLFFRALIGFRDDPDFFIFIDVPESVIDERMKYRVICPKCQTSRNSRLLRTKKIGYDPDKKEFYLICDNPQCSGFGASKMVAKEGDSLGIEVIRNRLEKDVRILRKFLDLKGVPKAFLRNSVPVARARDFVDKYEITPAYYYEFEEKTKKIKTIEKSWVTKDDEGVDSYSLLPAPIVVSLIKQIAEILRL